MTEFTDFDQQMLTSLDRLDQVRERLIDYADWLTTEWCATSAEPVPFFEVHVQALDDGRTATKTVFVLHTHICPSGDCEWFDPDDT